ncbi:MAG TPA: protein kinase, partial [Kofleriaceae bacterium]
MAEAEPNTSAHSYEVLGKLAEGGQTEIFLARAKGLGAVERFMVLKRLKRAVTSHVERVKQFLDEAQRAAQLQHPNIAQVFEVGKLGGSYFFAMEFVNGETLQALMLHARTKKIQIPVRAVLTIGSAIAAGLHHAHDRAGTDAQPLAIVHGDVSPTNTLVSQEGIVKLVDFGVARAGELGNGKVSPYSSPEQCKGDRLDRRSDLYALGIVLWELLTLDPLYQRANDDDIKHAIETEEPTRPSAKRYDVPPELDAMILKLLAKNPDDRFQDADELLAAIEALAQKLSILLSTADLSRMMRLWFGTKSDPGADAATDGPPLVVASEQIPADLATAHTAIDDQLDAVRSAAALITARATERAGSTTGRQDRPTVPPELMDNPNENFEQIRDRILARARQKKETKNQPAGAAVPGVEQSHLSSGALTAAAPPASAAGVGPVAGPAAGTPVATIRLTSAQAPADDRHSRAAAQPPIEQAADRHTRTTAQAPIAMIEEAVRQAGIADPIELKASNGANGHATGDASPPTEEIANEPDKVIVEPDLRPSRTASGEFGSRGTSGIISRREASVVADGEGGREAPPATANVAALRHMASVDTTVADADAQVDADKAAASRAVTAVGSDEPAIDPGLANTELAIPPSELAKRDAAAKGAAAQNATAKDAAAKDATQSDVGIKRSQAGSDTARDSVAAAKLAAKAAAKDMAAAKLDKTASDKPATESTATRTRGTPPRATTERVVATAREADRAASGRPAWLLPVVAIAGLAIIFLVVMKLRGDRKSNQASAQSQTQAQTQPPQPPSQPPPAQPPVATAPTGSAGSADPTGVAPTGTVQDPAQKDPTGTTQANPTGAQTNPTGAQTNPTGAQTNPTGAQTNPTGAQTNPTGAQTNPTGTAQKDPSGTTQKDPAKDPVTKKDPAKDPVTKKDPVEKKEPKKDPVEK